MVLLPLRAVSPPFQLRNHSLQHFLPLQHKILPGLIHTKSQELAIIDQTTHLINGETWFLDPVFQRLCYGLNVCVLQNLYVEALIPSVTVFREGAWREVIKVKLGHKGEALILQ